jgi:hypothetical protein
MDLCARSTVQCLYCFIKVDGSPLVRIVESPSLLGLTDALQRPEEASGPAYRVYGPNEFQARLKKIEGRKKSGNNETRAL